MPPDSTDTNTEHPSSSPSSTFEALGQSETFLDFQEKLSKAAPIDRPVLLVGERGTGKELAATRLHYLSGRWQSPFVALNCAALAPSLLESELFGHEKGAFTGAQQRRPGRFETASGGTLFLDEIGNIPMEVQEKILRVVEYGSFERVGGSASVEVDVRILGATNADLPALADQGRFKPDLLDRLSFEVLFLPPLRERKGDIQLLAGHFASRMAYELGWDDPPSFSAKAARALENHPWFGNIRELKNVVERAVYKSDSVVVKHINFDPFSSPYDAPALPATDAKRVNTEAAEELDLTKFSGMPLKTAVENLEIHLLRQALKTSRYNQKNAAVLLGLTYDQFRGLRRKYKDSVA
ncbi:MAG: phage shock protein operon transcriptional activator [Desulfobacteraceae bacterium]|nr:phage shock protein operon transcriptional activator [Desulfobacteraceae bacterium]